MYAKLKPIAWALEHTDTQQWDIHIQQMYLHAKPTAWALEHTDTQHKQCFCWS